MDDKKKTIQDRLSSLSFRILTFRKIIGRKLKANDYKPKAIRGFTLVELLVTLSLFVILTGVVLFNQSKFNSSILLTNLAYDVAITIRQAQTFGINVREAPGGGGEFDYAYGVHFNNNDQKTIVLFVDATGNEKYDSANQESIDKYKIKKGNYIKEICVTPNGGTETCDSTDKYLDITFLRPDPDAIIKSSISSGMIDSAKIVISSPDGNTRYVLVNSTGHISIGR